jgi:predicted transcriptional regulator
MTFKKKIPDVSKEIYKEDLVAVLQDKYAVLGPLWVTNQLEWLNGVYSSFKNHDKFLIIVYLTKKTLDSYSRNFTRLSYEEFYKMETVEIAKFKINEISKALNIPKESARRKVNELESIGVIKRIKKKIIIDRSSFKYSKPKNTIIRISRFLSVVSKICENENIISKKISSENLEKIIKDNFSYIWKIYYEMQLPMMMTYKHIFKDLETFHIYGTCVVNQHLHTQNTNQLKMNKNEFIKSTLDHGMQGINAMSISDITGIPRATVIRKLQRLVLRNVLQIDNKKHYRLTDVFVEQLKVSQSQVFNHLANFSTKIFNFVIL